jgi:hypothetical protein
MGRKEHKPPVLSWWNVGRIRLAWAAAASPAKRITVIVFFVVAFLILGICRYQVLFRNGASGKVHSGENGITDAIIESLHGQKNGFFVEMGANDGINSNSLKLEQVLGWRGLCIEAGPTNFQKLQRNRPHCVNVHMVVADSPAGTAAIFREFPDGPLYGHSGLLASRTEAEWQDLLESHPSTYTDLTVQTNTMAQILADQQVVPPLDYFVSFAPRCLWPLCSVVRFLLL